jgi:hypothetical protein
VKRYATTYSNGHTVETSSCHEACNFPNHGGQMFFLTGKEVTATRFYAAAEAAVQDAYAKKCETHKRVSVQQGATQFGRVTKWVRK